MICNICRKRINRKEPYVEVIEHNKEFKNNKDIKFYHKSCFINKISEEKMKKMAMFMKLGMAMAKREAKKMVEENEI